MKTPRKILAQAAVSVCFGAAFLFLVVPTVQTYPPFLSKAKSMGFAANDCTYCHVNAGGGEPYNARGKWLIAEKGKRGASAVDVAWLKEYGRGGAARPKAKEKASVQNPGASKAPTDVNAAIPGTRASAVVANASTPVAGREPVRALSGSMMGNQIMTRLANDRPGFNYVITGARLVNGKLQFDGSVRSAAARGTSSGGGTPATATLVGTLSQARNPWPNAADESAPQRRDRQRAATGTENPASSAGQTQTQGRETRNPENTAQLGSLSQSTQPTARTTQTPTAPDGQRPRTGEANEQTQSLYSSADVGLGCEILYLKLMLPARVATMAKTQGQPVQIGVVLAPIDNKRGEEINNQVCRVVHALNSEQGAQAAETQVAQLNRLLSGAGGASSSGSGGGR